jgi:hypothetical protein
MIVYRNREDLLRVVLADDVFIECGHDIARGRNLNPRSERRGLFKLFGEDIVAEVDTLVADIHARACHELADLLLGLSAERADQVGCTFTEILAHS